ncbi:histidine kinase [Microbacterium sp.]|uniref:sensor histidine kinase n=1 Tax=Microbacterium sp. TaxID=51671 RepID=UPI0033407422
MSTPHSRSPSIRQDEELRLPRPPGVIRRFWARHPVLADIIIAFLCLVFSVLPAGTLGSFGSGDDPAREALRRFGAVAIPVTVFLACLLLLRRRQWPTVAFTASLVASATYLYAPVPTGGPLLLATSYALAVYRSSRACWIGLGVGLGTLTLYALTLSWSGVIPFQIAINTIVGEAVVGLFGALIGVNVGNRKRYLEAVIDRSRQLLVERDQHAQLAAAAERERIAREMHDIVSHSLTVVVALSEGAAATPDRDRARDASNAAAATARSALTELRSMLGVLRDGDGDAPLAPSAPISPQETVDAARRAGYAVTLRTAGAHEVAPALAFAIGRIVQEGVTNAMRHAPSAASIDVLVDYAADPLVVEVRNDGVVTAMGEPGFGLRGLAERAAHLGGTFRSGAIGGGRWILRAELPVDDQGEPEREEPGAPPAEGSAEKEEPDD